MKDVAGAGFTVFPKPQGVKGAPDVTKHGTRYGYERGCRDRCPGDEAGQTCREAASAYQRKYRAGVTE